MALFGKRCVFFPWDLRHTYPLWTTWVQLCHGTLEINSGEERLQKAFEATHISIFKGELPMVSGVDFSLLFSGVNILLTTLNLASILSKEIKPKKMKILEDFPKIRNQRVKG